MEDKKIIKLAQEWVSELNGVPFNSTSEEMCFQSYAYEDGYKKGFNDALEKAKRIIISFMPLPSHKNHNMNYNIELLKERMEYGKVIAKKFEKIMNEDERGVKTE